METSKSSAALLLIFMLFLSSATPILSCGHCGGKPHPKPKSPSKGGPIHLPKIPPVTVPTVPLPKLPVPPVTVPNVPLPKVPVPPVTVPTVPIPKLPVPPVTVPTVPIPKLPVPNLPIPPVTGGSKSPPAACPPPPAKKETCPIDVLKLGACVDLLGGIVHVGLGDPVVNKCCPVLAGLVEVEAAVCLCTTLKIKALNLNIYVPLALELLITCGKSPPPGYTCSL
ncbi:unnamed protein product [Linum trigynum]|uniref:Bifunctional inhibitor/plant lipid transfer protein/seed storage helical domain-containing protein n=1 Tax=Linum trigynum TaxID=586398 RepID=A0AAV2CSB2_9ROSI